MLLLPFPAWEMVLPWELVSSPCECWCDKPCWWQHLRHCPTHCLQFSRHCWKWHWMSLNVTAWKSSRLSAGPVCWICWKTLMPFWQWMRECGSSRWPQGNPMVRWSQWRVITIVQWLSNGWMAVNCQKIAKSKEMRLNYSLENSYIRKLSMSDWLDTLISYVASILWNFGYCTMGWLGIVEQLGIVEWLFNHRSWHIEKG